MEVVVEKYYTAEEWNKYPRDDNRKKDVYIVSVSFNDTDYMVLTIDEGFDILKIYGFGLIDMSNPFKYKKEILEKINEFKNIRESKSDSSEDKGNREENTTSQPKD